ncbi:MAG: hypothetical protein ABW168_01170 [Sedimenticola sp.]
MMKPVLIIILCAISIHALADNRPSNDCIELAHVDYSKAFNEYWNLIDKEFESRSPKLYPEFSYLIKEQLNSSKMHEIKLSYFLKYHPDKLDLDKEIFRVMPSAANYSNEYFREIRKIPEYDQLYLENYSYRHNIKMPNYEKLQTVSQLLSDIKSKASILAFQHVIMKKASKPVMELDCDS